MELDKVILRFNLPVKKSNLYYDIISRQIKGLLICFVDIILGIVLVLLYALDKYGMTTLIVGVVVIILGFLSLLSIFLRATKSVNLTAKADFSMTEQILFYKDRLLYLFISKNMYSETTIYYNKIKKLKEYKKNFIIINDNRKFKFLRKDLKDNYLKALNIIKEGRK